MSEEPHIHVSLIIPAYNEADYLPRLLDSVDIARANYGRGHGTVEVIVADNCSTDKTPGIAVARGCHVVTVEKRVIGAVRNGGASAAVGRVLAFVDADSRIHPQTFNQIDAVMRNERVIAGASGFRFERWSPGLLVTYCAFVPLVLLTGIDTGVVFCRRTDFDAVGGYREDVKFGEDAAFFFAMVRRGLRRGQRLARLDGAKAITSARKFDKFGDWHYLTLGPRVLFEFMTGVQGGVADDYWYKPGR